MIDQVRFTLTLIAALGCGLVGGVFFAFSSFVMRALGRIAAAQGIAAMQSINIVVINPLFMAALFGTGAICTALGAWSLVRWHDPASAYLLGGGLLYLVGTIGVTIICNVPRNDALAGVDSGSAQGASVWADYLSGWTRWNTVRTVAALAAATLLMLALRR